MYGSRCLVWDMFWTSQIERVSEEIAPKRERELEHAVPGREREREREQRLRRSFSFDSLSVDSAYLTVVLPGTCSHRAGPATVQYYTG